MVARQTQTALLVALLTLGCASGDDATADTELTADTGAVPGDAAPTDVPDTYEPPPIVLDPPPPDIGIYGHAGGCYVIEGFDGVTPWRYVGADADVFAFSQATSENAARFRMRASDLGTYLFYDTDRRYLTAAETASGGWQFARVATLQSSVQLLDDAFRSPAEWVLEVSARDAQRYQLKHYQSGRYLALDGLTGEAAEAGIITLRPAADCADFPELTVDAQGQVEPRKWDDGDAYGIAEIHSHMMSNFGFGGGGIFHGAPFHRLGVEHALPDCVTHHGEEGRRDIVGFFYDGGSAFDVEALAPIVFEGQVPEPNHVTAGYPDFTEWPNPRHRSTHQSMYYRWLQRAWMAGLRLVVQHATGNSVLCDLITGIGAQGVRYSCNDMVSVERSILETRNLERYIDAQAGGPGKGWFRVVESPEQARDVIAQGKLAVVLGIEISNLFDCFSTPKPGFEACTPEIVQEQLDYYQALGVRAVFPVHKYDNAFSAGDGSGGIIELGNIINSGHYSNFVEDCPGPSAAFDGGGVTFGGLNKPRDEYDAPPPLDMTGFADDVVKALLPLLSDVTKPGLSGNFCQKHGLTPLGETLLHELMARGMIPDIAHLPQRALGPAYEILEAANYPATKTHGGINNGRIYGLGGLVGVGLGRCADPEKPGNMVAGMLNRIQEAVSKGAYPAEALSFDLNGFAGAPRPRFGPDSGCAQPQPNPMTYPFTSYDGKVTFTQPHLGNREVSFDTEGMIHIGLLPELIEDVRRNGATDADLEPLFRSAEAYIRMWEKAEEAGR